ncbi:unannotated protein [freshwater metagenome]|uniref:Unannotated protein n=1 Tax=freshwater metagenome TaxID=449393 RepID=A0A6J6DIY4_9ZZZZ|nr:DUF1801 domain-containing protein [Actinomycetota bacterium]
MAGSKSAFSDVEKEAMQARAREAREFKKLSGEEQVQLKIAEMSKADQKLAKAVHKLVLGISPTITTRTWYGMPAYYVKDKIICFFQAGSKFESRYSTFGFQESAKLDDGPFWATSFALIELNDDVAKKITKLVKKAIS